jgi:3'-5' exoribonuclease
MKVDEIRALYEETGGRDSHAEGRFAVINCTFKEGKGGRFATVELRDGTGSFTARCFDAVICDGLETAGAIDARLRVGEFNGTMSVVVNAYDVAELSRDDVLELAGLDLEVHRARIAVLEGWLAECDGTPYGEVLRAALDAGPTTWDDFCMVPAAVRLHHAEPGGLVRHLVEVGSGGLGLLDSIGREYDRPYFLAGVFLHDIGKLDTYTMPPTITYTAQGQMGEHQIWSTFRLAKACARVDAAPSTEAKLLHIIEQAHGAYKHAEWQDAVGPEVKALAAADFFSSRLGETDKEKRTRDLLDRLLASEDEPAAAAVGAGAAGSGSGSGGLF